MKKNILLCIVIFVASTCAINAATKISARDGGFGLASTWADNTPPGSGDNIIILAGHNVHGTGGAVVGELIVRGRLTLSHPGLTVNGNMLVENGGLISNLTGAMYFNGETCINDGTIATSIYFNSDDTQSISGGGDWKVNLGVFNGGTKVLDDVKMIEGTWNVNSQVIILKRWLMTGGKINKSDTGIIESPLSGYVEFQGLGHFSSNETTGNLWKSRIMVKDGTRAATSTSSISAPVNVESGATLSTFLNVVLNLKELIIIKSGGKLSGQTIRLFGEYVVNHGEVFPTVLEFNSDGNQEISGEGAWRNSNAVYLRGSGTKSLGTDMNISDSALTVESPLNLNNYNLTLNWGTFKKLETGVINGTGKVILKGNGYLYSNETTGNLWGAPIVITTGAYNVYSSSTLSAFVMVESGATLATSLNVTLHIKNNVWIKDGAKLSGQTVRLSGANVINNGEIFPTILEFDRDEEQEIGGGTGVYRSSNAIYFRGSGRKSLLNDITTSVGSVVVESRLNLNDHIFTVNGGNFSKPAAGTIFGTGKVVSTGTGYIYSHETEGNLWSAPLEIASGSRAANSTSSFTAPITVISGATLSTTLRVTINAIGGLTIEPGASVTGESLALYNGDFINNGAVATVRTLFNGSNTLSGTTGSFVNSAYFKPGATVKLDGIQQFRNLHVENGGAFDISNQTIKVSGILSAVGTLMTNASTIEFNSTSAEQSVPTNIDYYNLTINNSREVNLGAPETVRSILRLEKGIFDIAANRLTIGSCGQIVYVNGTLRGTPVNLNCSQNEFIGNKSN